MVTITKKRIISATTDNEWALGNKILYDMCFKYPKHDDKSVIIAKVWLIGRSYAAAIERRKNTGKGEFNGDDFYLERVAPKIINSGIDEWLYSLCEIKDISTQTLGSILSAHLNVTDLFSSISGLEKRSLASKYLHFHYPNLFFIYDSRAVNAMSHLSTITGRVGKSKYNSDNEYRKFCEKCIKIKDYVKEKYNINLSPRNIDNLLLEIEANA